METIEMPPDVRNEFNAAVEAFPWDSEDQKKGYLSLVQFRMRFGLWPHLPIDYNAAFFIQKDIDSHVYWLELVSTQFSDLQNVIASDREKNSRLESRIDQLEMTVRAQMTAIEALTKRNK